MSARRADIAARLPQVLGLSEPEAAAYIGVSANTFADMVREGVMPRPLMIGTRRLWDIDEIRAAFKSLPREGDTSSPVRGGPNPWDTR